MSDFDRIPPINWKLEPGDGTGCSPADSHARNGKGICGVQGCGNTVAPSAVSYALVGQLCTDCCLKRAEAWARIVRQDDEQLMAELERLSSDHHG